MGYKSRKEIYALNGVLFLFFAYITFNSPWWPSNELLLLTSDANTYFDTGKELFESYSPGYSIIRPFFYPAFLYLIHGLGGAWLVVFVQFLFWVISGNLIFLILKKCTLTVRLSFGFILLFVLNISLIGYTFHGLTELISTFLIAWFIYLLLHSNTNKITASLCIKMLSILALLTVIKPLFQYPFLIFLLFVLVRFGKEFIQNRGLIVAFVLALSPVVLQISIMKVKHNQLKVSTIDSYTLDRYLVAQGIRKVNGIEDVEASQKMAIAFTKKEQSEFIRNNKGELARLFFTNVKENVDAYESNFMWSEKYTVLEYYDFMDRYNRLLYLISLPIVIIFCLLFVVDFFKKRLNVHWKMYFIGTLLYYIVFSSGISFWQADRLIIFALPLWIVLYAMMLHRLLTFLQSSRKQQAANLV